MAIQTITAHDGSTVKFEDKNHSSGAMKDVYFSPDRQYVVAFYRPTKEKPKLTEMDLERIKRLVGKYREDIFGQAGGDYWRNLFCWPEKTVQWNNMIGLVMPAFRPNFFFTTGERSGTEKTGGWFSSGKNFNRFLPPGERGDLSGFLGVALELSRGVRRLHSSGLAHSDLSYNNCLIDPSSGHACIIDIDGLVVPGLFPPDVLGTPEFIAPEVRKTLHLSGSQRILPSTATDKHALAVLIYLYLFHRHPLRGGKFHHEDVDVQTAMELGEKALYIEHPSDKSNRPLNRDVEFQPWSDCAKLPAEIMGPHLPPLFRQAFVDGLHNPQNRPGAGDWEDAIVRTQDLLVPCVNPQCVKKWYAYVSGNKNSRPVCPYCGTKFKGPLLILDFHVSAPKGQIKPDNRRLIIAGDKKLLYPWHADRTISRNEHLRADQRKRVGYFGFKDNHWLFINEALNDLTDIDANRKIPSANGGQPTSANCVELPDGKRLLLAPEPNGRIVTCTTVQC